MPSAWAITETSRASGLDWLLLQVGPDGAVTAEAASVATAAQLRSEAVLTLTQEGRAAPAGLVQRLQNQGWVEAESVARSALAVRSTGGDATTSENLLQSMQRTDGGVVASAEAGASAIDTAWALRALVSRPDLADAAASWLRQRQALNGSWEAAPRSTLVTTALALRALRELASRNADAAASAVRAADYLLAQRNATGLWDTTVWVNALVFDAVHDYLSAESSVRATVRDWLMQAQAPDGSWGADVYTTALAIRALRLSEQVPVNPVFGIVRGRAIDATTGQALQGVAVSLNAGARQASTSAEGSFEFRDLDPGVYSLALQLAEYGGLSADVTAGANQTADLGDLPMLKLAGATTATVRGVVVDAATGAAIASAEVLVSGIGGAQTLADGTYQLTNVTTGTHTLTARRTGYLDSTATIDAAAGNVFVFSPRLVASGSTPPSGTSNEAAGVVVDAGTGSPLSGASVTVMIAGGGSYQQLTAADGSFRFTGLPGGSTSGLAVVNVRLVNYGEAFLSVFPPYSVGTVRLLRSAAAVLLPDLVVSSVTKTNMTTDPQRLTVGGSITAHLSNLGTLTAAAGSAVTAFEDRDRNGRLDREVDLVLGVATLGVAIAPSATAELPIPVTGTVRFRDNQVHVMVDSDLASVEGNEQNNVAVCECTTGLPFIEDFNDGVADGVTFVPNQGGFVGTWAVTNGYMTTQPWAGGAMFGSRAWRDYDAEVKVMFPDGASNDAGINFRMLDRYNWYQLRFKAGHTRYVSIVDGRLNAQVAEAPFPVEPDRWYVLKVEVRGSTVKGYIDGALVLTYTGLEIPEGAVGIMTDSGVVARFDDLRVFDVPLLSEDFSDPAANQFQPANFNPLGNAPATVINGELVRNSYGSSWAGDRSWSNYSAEVGVKFPNGLTNDAGIVVLASNPPTGPIVQVTLNGDLLRMVTTSGSPTGQVVAAQHVPVSTDPNHRYAFRMEVIDQTAKFYFEGNYVFEHANVGWSTGAVGVNQDGVVAAYDNFVVRSLRGAIDLTASYVRVTDAGSSGTSRVTVRIGNGGTRPTVSGAPVALYRGAPSPANLVATVSTTVSLSQGEFQDVSFDVAGGLASLGVVTIVADDDGTGTSRVVECTETNNSIQVDLSELAVQLNVAVAASQATYTELDTALFTATVGNTGSFNQPAQVRFAIETIDGLPAQSLALPASTTVAAGAQAGVNAAWPVLGVLTGEYRVRAELIDAGGIVYASSVAPFSVEASNTAHVGARVSSDRVQYSAAQSIQLRSRVLNATTNMLLENLSTTTELLNAGGQQVWVRSEPPLQLAARNSREFSYSVAAGGLTPGAYTALLSVRDSLGNLRTSSSAQLTVLGTDFSGVGLRGSLEVPTTLALGQTAALGYSVVNGGNAALSAVPLTLRLVDPQAAVLRGEFALSATLGVGASQAGAVNWTASGQAGDIVAVLAATVGGREQVLAQAPFRLTGTQSAIDLATAPRTDRDVRLLVLMSCLVSGVDDATCVQQRSAAVATLLDGFGVPYRIVSTAADFTTELRCGRYNSYWISGGAAKLSDQTVKEIREAVRRGDGLMLDGPQNGLIAQDDRLQAVAGVHQWENLSGQNYTIDVLTGNAFEPGPLATLGQPAKFVLTTGQPVAMFNQYYPAIVLNHYGEGNGVVLAFDYAAMLAAPGGVADARLRGLLDDSLDTVASAPTQLTVADEVRLATNVENQGAQVVDVEVRATLPTGVSFVDAYPAPTQVIPPSAGVSAQVIWRLDLLAASSADFKLRVRVDGSGLTAMQVPVEVYSRSGTSAPVLQGTVTHDLPVLDGLALTNDAYAAIEALAPTSSYDQGNRGYAINAATMARTRYQTGDYAGAISKWITAADLVAQITTDDVARIAAAQRAIALATEAATDRLCHP